jgi:hypothetical protein
MRIDLAHMEHRLGRAIPLHYREFVGTRSLEGLELTAAAPAEIAALNMEQLAAGADGPRRFGFALYSSDGDCLLVRDGDDSGMVFEWSHETRDISAREFHVSELLEKLAALPIAQIEAEDPTVVISRVTPWSQSILDPIHFSELAVAAAEVPEASCFGCLESANPFTSQPMRFEVPGLRIELPASEPILLKLEHGRLTEQVELRPIPEPLRSLARRLKAQVFGHGS